MSQSNKDLPANPCQEEANGNTWEYSGLSKREYAAIHILAGLSSPANALSYDLKVQLAVKQADALFLELDKKQ